MTSSGGPGPAGSGPAGHGAPGAPGPGRARIRPYLDAPASTAPGPDRQPGAGDEPGSTDGGARPRPFVLTSGRVDGVDPAIALETQVTARPVFPRPVASLAPELQAILAICAEPVSVAEISARVPLHLGVAKVLVGDLRASGYLDVHTMDVVTPDDPETILRVIRGLRAIA